MSTSEIRRPDGFLNRGKDVTRTEAFVDAAFAFAFAVSLLVITEGLPTSVTALKVGLLNVPALACCFLMIAMFWFAHNTWSRRYGLDDTRSVALSLTLVFLVLIYVFPMRMLFGSLFAWTSGMLLPPDWRIPWTFAVEGYADIRSMFVIYGIAWTTMGAVIAALYRRAWTFRDELGLDSHERIVTRVEYSGWLCVPATGLLSVVVALTLPSSVPGWLLGAPGFVYFAMFAIQPIKTRVERRARLAEEARAEA